MLLLPSAELYNPTTNSFASTGEMLAQRYWHTATLLNDGRVLITGGCLSPYQYPCAVLSVGEIYDPATGTFTNAGQMTSPRVFHTSTLLRNGKVLITGGSDGTSSIASAEIYDPVKGKFTSIPSMLSPRSRHTATLLRDGSVLIAGGEDSTGWPPVSTAEIYDPEAELFRFTGSMAQPRSWHTATLLNGGKVLLAGSIPCPQSAAGCPPAFDWALEEIYDPVFGTFTATGHALHFHFGHQATLLNNGNVLLTGGVLDYLPSELYDTSTGTFLDTGSPPEPTIAYHTATLLTNGLVLATGGRWDFWFYDQAELYLPETLVPPGLVSIAITPRPSQILAGDARQFVATGTFSDGTKQTLYSVTWTSSAPDVAKISASGIVYGEQPGTATIAARTGSIEASITITVKSKNKK